MRPDAAGTGRVLSELTGPLPTVLPVRYAGKSWYRSSGRSPYSLGTMVDSPMRSKRPGATMLENQYAISKALFSVLVRIQ